MLNGNSGLETMPHPQPSVLDIQGIQIKGQVGVVIKEPYEVVIPSVAELQGPKIFVNAP